MSTPYWWAEAVRLIQKVARDDRPVYVLTRETSDDRFDALDESIHGLSGASADLSLRDLIGADWRGRGPAMFVNERRVRAEHRWDSPSVIDNHLISLCLHEAGHWYADRDIFDRKEPEEFSDLESVAVTAQRFDLSEAERNAQRIRPKRAADPWNGHEPHWIRIMCHIAYRVSRNGFGVPIWEMKVAGRHYGLSHAAVYEYLLRDEVREQFELPLLDVAEIPIPAAVYELFEEDCDRHIKRYLDQTEILARGGGEA